MHVYRNQYGHIRSIIIPAESSFWRYGVHFSICFRDWDRDGRGYNFDSWIIFDELSLADRHSRLHLELVSRMCDLYDFNGAPWSHKDVMVLCGHIPLHYDNVINRAHLHTIYKHGLLDVLALLAMPAHQALVHFIAYMKQHESSMRIFSANRLCA